MNAFSKEEKVAFEDILEGFNDALVLSRYVSRYGANDRDLERSEDTVWRPMPYVARSYDGADQTANFLEKTQLSVPANIGYEKSSPWLMTTRELRDALQENRLGEAAKQKLASDINVAITNVASLQGTIVVAQSAAASGFADLAEADSAMNEIGVDMGNRCAGITSRDYNLMAQSLSNRGTVNDIVKKAYERAYIDMISGFDTLKMDYGRTISAATATGVSINGAGQFYVPAARSTAATGEKANVDNRSQTISVTVTAGTLAVGDSFTIAGVNKVHLITKEDQLQPKTFRVTEIVTGGGGTGTIKVSPPIISGGGSSDAELSYQNVTATPVDGAAITMLNTVAAKANPFWHKSAIELMGTTEAIDAGAGWEVMKATTDQGIEVNFMKQADINLKRYKYRLDVLFGVTMLQPEMAGILLFGQT